MVSEMLQTVKIELSEFIQKYKPYLIIITKNKLNQVISIVGWIEGETTNYPVQISVSNDWERILENQKYMLINVQYRGSQKILMFKR